MRSDKSKKVDIFLIFCAWFISFLANGFVFYKGYFNENFSVHEPSVSPNPKKFWCFNYWWEEATMEPILPLKDGSFKKVGSLKLEKIEMALFVIRLKIRKIDCDLTFLHI